MSRLCVRQLDLKTTGGAWLKLSCPRREDQSIVMRFISQLPWSTRGHSQQRSHMTCHNSTPFGTLEKVTKLPE